MKELAEQVVAGSHLQREALWKISGGCCPETENSDLSRPPTRGGWKILAYEGCGAGTVRSALTTRLCLLQIQLQADGEECISDSEKAALDLKDPNRPRFTLQELRDVLHERNELKSKVFLLQEELAYYKR